ncbi:hypothetical protein H5410_030013 [Solanum commersonii]|uniref:PB1-like domain-containing protein n=1 Tax=Solanum commersonii TaxID=4109 RepID=A0A9J5YD30_SOLCO|nr:hypothetical protein H5410_030013 [Solanum commersonii]
MLALITESRGRSYQRSSSNYGRSEAHGKYKVRSKSKARNCYNYDQPGNLIDIIIVTRFHHGGKFVEGTSGGGLIYIGESEVEYVGIDKDHFSLMELLFYTRDLGYVTVGGFYFKDPTTNNFVLVDNDFSLLNLIKDLGDGDLLDLYVQHVVDEVEVIKDGVPTDDDDSEIDEELRTIKNERRTKLQRTKPVPTEKIILGVVGVDRGFEDI